MSVLVVPILLAPAAERWRLAGGVVVRNSLDLCGQRWTVLISLCSVLLLILRAVGAGTQRMRRRLKRLLLWLLMERWQEHAPKSAASIAVATVQVLADYVETVEGGACHDAGSDETHCVVPWR